METTITRFIRSNPKLMISLLTNPMTDLGHGLEGKVEHRLHHSDYDMTTRDHLEFTFYLEGKEIGSLDHEWGGYIQGVEVDDFTLMDKITQTMEELFPGVNVYVPQWMGF